MKYTIRCENEECEKVMGVYEGSPFWVLAQKTIGEFIVFVKMGRDYPGETGDIDAKILCRECLNKLPPLIGSYQR